MGRVIIKLVLLFILSYVGVTVWYGRFEERLLDFSTRAGQEQGVALQDAAASTAPTESLPKTEEYTIITKRNIFAAVITAPPVQVEDEVEPENLEPTRLKLALKGTVSGADRDARAIIADKLKNRQDIYQVGDSIQGALIVAIERGRVILEVNGRDEVLNLEERKGGGPAYEPSPADYYREPRQAEPVPTADEVNARKKTRLKPAVRPRPTRRTPAPHPLAFPDEPR